MDVNEIIRILSDIRSKYNCFDAEDEECYRGLSEAIKMLSTQQWIPCKTRHPEESGTYIVTAYDGVNNKRVSFVKYQKTLKRWDLTGLRSYWSILAYKPLPEPWKGEQHG